MYYWRMAILMLRHSLINEGNILSIVVDLVLPVLDQTSGKLTEEIYNVHLQLFLIYFFSNSKCLLDKAQKILAIHKRQSRHNTRYQ